MLELFVWGLCSTYNKVSPSRVHTECNWEQNLPNADVYGTPGEKVSVCGSHLLDLLLPGVTDTLWPCPKLSLRCEGDSDIFLGSVEADTAHKLVVENPIGRQCNETMGERL